VWWKVAFPDSKLDMPYPKDVQTQSFGKHIPFQWSQTLTPVYKLHSSPENHDNCQSSILFVHLRPRYLIYLHFEELRKQCQYNFIFVPLIII
jgi:hypothetical protein